MRLGDEEEKPFDRKSKKYRKQYLHDLQQLYGESEHDKECQLERRSGADIIRDLVEKAGD